ncbi:hypothetical protein [Endozoicomonas sp. SESOKO1]|uniref:DUF7173 family protein n=1 Tax=Endozoicomonas sp. SESOKO1 TaxID=2828742 RepID=UPI0021473401|nr:hypothetical protein [Endozoicomonas sp. SESOKO1]
MSESNDASRLDKLAYELELAKQTEQQAKDHRLSIEQQLSEVVGVKDEGSHTLKGAYYKVTTSSGYTRTLDEKKWDEVKSRIPEAVANNLVRTKTELNIKQLKSLQSLDPAQYNIVAEAVTTKPKKVSIKFERLEGDQ